MRVAIVNSLRVSGGGERWVCRMAACWRMRGLDPVIVCQPGSGLEMMARDAGLNSSAVTMRHDLSLAGVLGLAKELRRLQPDVVLCCNERAFRLTVPALLGLSGIPLLYRNGLTATFKDRRLNRLYFPRVARMVVNAEALRAEMRGFGWIPESRLTVIRNGIDPSLYEADADVRIRIRREMGTSEDAVVAAVLARLTPEKGQVETLRAFAQAGTPGAELWFAGEGTLLGELELLTRSLGVSDRVRFLGFRNDVPDLLRAIDLVVQASYREGLANTFLEAMAARLPVVASNVGGVADIVTPGVTGLVVPAGEIPALQEALTTLLTDAPQRRALGEAGRVRVESEFSLERETDEWCRLLDEVRNAPTPSL